VQGRKGAAATAVHYKLDGVDYTTTPHGTPILAAAMAWLDCEMVEEQPIGDHILVTAMVLDGAVEKEAEAMTSGYTGWTYSG
jgi:flavin reductase (DIM6/NTAB) family NADH-FMN oxidoreductase RutF